MEEIEKLKQIKEIDYDRYVDISSLEKLAVYAINYLEENEIETTWTNVVIATCYLFPRRFAISEDFLDFPNTERVNRTLMHLVPPKGRNYAIGSTRESYVLTPLGREVVAEVKNAINEEPILKNRQQEVISSIKNTPMTVYSLVKNSKEYASYLAGTEFSDDMIWSLFDVIPFTQKKTILKKLTTARAYCLTQKDNECLAYIGLMINCVKK